MGPRGKGGDCGGGGAAGGEVGEGGGGGDDGGGGLGEGGGEGGGGGVEGGDGGGGGAVGGGCSGRLGSRETSQTATPTGAPMRTKDAQQQVQSVVIGTREDRGWVGTKTSSSSCKVSFVAMVGKVLSFVDLKDSNVK
jgi:hypothetical protein